MIGDMRGHRVRILRNNDALLAFGPRQFRWILAPERQVGESADPHDVHGINSLSVMPFQSSQKSTSKVLRHHVTQRNGQGTLAASERFHATKQLPRVTTMMT